MIGGGHLCCPTCHAYNPATSAEQFPISYIAEAFVKYLKHKQAEGASVGATSQTNWTGLEAGAAEDNSLSEDVPQVLNVSC